MSICLNFLFFFHMFYMHFRPYMLSFWCALLPLCCSSVTAHSKELRFVTAHSKEFRFVTAHRNKSRLATAHSEESRFVTTHSEESRFVTPGRYGNESNLRLSIVLMHVMRYVNAISVALEICHVDIVQAISVCIGHFRYYVFCCDIDFDTHTHAHTHTHIHTYIYIYIYIYI